jgi:hypothetical protein
VFHITVTLQLSHLRLIVTEQVGNSSVEFGEAAASEFETKMLFI